MLFMTIMPRVRLLLRLVDEHCSLVLLLLMLLVALILLLLRSADAWTVLVLL